MGVNGRALGCVLRETKNCNQNFVAEATSTGNGLKFSFKATYYPLPDATLMWRTGRVEPLFYAFVGKLSGNVFCVPFFNA